MKIPNLFLLAFFLLAGFCPLFGQNSILTLQPDATQGKDAFLSSYSSGASTNYGNHALLSARAWTSSGNPTKQHGLLDFDLSALPDNAVILEANLTLTPYTPTNSNTLSGNNAFLIRRITDGWEEESVTWNSRPGTDTEFQVFVPMSSTAAGYQNIDVTDLIRDRLSNPNANFGLYFQLLVEQHYRSASFCSSDHADAGKRPKLELTYKVIAPHEAGKLQVNFKSGSVPTVSSDGVASFSDPALQTLFSNIGAVHFEKSYPAAEGINDPHMEDLLSIYSVTVSSNLETAIALLDANTANIEEVGYAWIDEVHSYYPNDYGDLSTEAWKHSWLSKINAPEAWDITHGSSDINIAIIDVGFNENHSELKNKSITRKIGNAPSCQKYHGTPVAGAAAGHTDNNTKGASIGFESSLMLYSAGGGCNGVSSSKGYNYMLDAAVHGANVINCSYGGPSYSSSHQNTINKVTNMGVIVVASAGNGNQPNANGTALHYPASYNNVLSVSSTHPDDALESLDWCDQTQYHHTHNTAVDILAPGMCLYLPSQTATSNSNFLGARGTSFAAPVVAGTVALMLAANPCLSASDVESILKLTGENVGNIVGNTGVANSSFYNNNANQVPKRVDAHAAVVAAQSYVIPTQIVHSGQTLNVVDNGYRNGGYIVKSGGTLIFKAGTDNYLCRGGGQNIVVEGGGNMIIEDNASVHVFKNGYIHVEDNGQLVLQNAQPGKGLVLGSIEGHYTAELKLEGHMIVYNGANLATNGEGRISVEGNGTIAFQTGAGINWDMNSNGRLHIGEYNNLIIAPNYFNVNNGLITFGDLANLTINTDLVEMDEMLVVPITNTTSVDNEAVILNTTEANITNSHFEGFEIALVINCPFTGPITQSTITLDDCKFYYNSEAALETFYATTLNVLNSTFEDNQVGISALGQALANTTVTVSNTEILNCFTGISTVSNDVLQLEQASLIDGSNKGIEGILTNVYVRQNSQISSCNYGIYMLNNTSNSHNLITIGDEDCGNIINNTFGMYCSNMLLDADAIGHNAGCQGCPNVANRFDGNNKLAFFCYTANAPSQIFVTGAYFGSTNPNSVSGIDAQVACTGKFSLVKIPIVTEDECPRNPGTGCWCPPPSCNPCGEGGGSTRLSTQQEQAIDGAAIVADPQLSLFPNPTSNGQFTIEVDGFDEHKTIEVLNVYGKVIAKISLTENASVVDLSDYAKGIYLVRVTDGKHKKMQKVVLN